MIIIQVSNQIFHLGEEVAIPALYDGTRRWRIGGNGQLKGNKIATKSQIIQTDMFFFLWQK